MKKLYKVEFIFNSKREENLIDYSLQFDIILHESTYEVVKREAYEKASRMEIPSRYEYVKSFQIINEELCNDL